MQTSALSAILPPQLVQALNELQAGANGQGQAVGGDFWQRLAAQLEQLEGALPDDGAAGGLWEQLAAQVELLGDAEAAVPEDAPEADPILLLLAGLDGDGLPEDGKDLPLAAALLMDPARAGQDPARDAVAVHRARLLAAALHAASAGTAAVSGDAAGTGPVNPDSSDLRARLGEILAELRAMPGTAVDARAGTAAPLSAVSPAVLLGLQVADDGAAASVQGLSTGVVADPRAADPQPFANLNGAGAAEAVTGRSLLEAAALAARIADNPAQTAAPAGMAASAVDTVAGGQPGATNTPAPRGFSLDIPLQQPGWDRAFANGVRWMVNQNVQVAEMRLSPPNLGPLEVRLQVDGDRTQINIVAPHATTREAVEAALPRLREMFAESGLNLGDVNVRQESAGRGGAGGGDQPGQALAGTVPGGAEEGNRQDSPRVSAVAQGLVDFYA